MSTLQHLPMSASLRTACMLLALGASATAQHERTEIGGACTAVHTIEAYGIPWALSNVGNHLHVAPVLGARARAWSIEVEGFIRGIEVVEDAGRTIALLSTGSEGIVAVDVTDPRHMQQVAAVGVNFHQEGLTWTEGGGDIVTDTIIDGTRGNIAAMVSDGVELWIADEDFGIHRTPLANLLDAGGPVLEDDGTLVIEHEVFTLQYAGEVPWGGPRRLLLHGGRLFAALGFLGMGIYDPQSLEKVGSYNLYTDTSMHEDWFIDMDVAQQVQPGFLDPSTGMPDFRQASFEILEVWHGGVEAPTPWADFDRYGKYYYNGNALALADFGERTIAYLAAGLGGLVAIDVTGFASATSGDPLTGTRLGYAPAVPAHGPDEPTGSGGGQGSQTLFSHHGAGMLKEAGAVDVAVVGTELYFTDHFGGMIVLAGADDPAANWHGPDAPYDNDDPTLGDGVLGDHWPDDEFVTSYDMDPSDPTDDESLPVWLSASPCLLCTGEVSGHGGPLGVVGGMDPHGPGIDLLMAVGAGGMNYLDVRDLHASNPVDRWAVAKYFPTTAEIGARADGRPRQTISIGHTQGVTVSDEFLYVADGPHGVSAWRIREPTGEPVQAVHLVANTLQDESIQVIGNKIVLPTPHAYGTVYDATDETLYVLCQSLGLRRVDVSVVEHGLAQVGRPRLLAPQTTDVFEHNTDGGSVEGLPKQDHAFDVVLEDGLAFVADGGNGLTIYDLSKDPTDLQSGFVLANLGGSAGAKAELGRSTGIALWHGPGASGRYALLAAGPRGVGVVDVGNPSQPELVKVFEPIKLENGKVGKADGRAVDVLVVGDHAYFSYDSFGVVCYAVADLVAPLPAGVDPTEIWKVQGGTLLFDHRPVAVSTFRLANVAGYEDIDGGALNMSVRELGGVVTFQIAYAAAGVATVLWSDPAQPLLLEVLPTPGEAASVVEHMGMLYVADSAGGLSIFD